MPCTPKKARTLNNMPREIERKFLVCNDDYRKGARKEHIIQAYLKRDPKSAVRIRVSGNKAFLTIKGYITDRSRHEFEYGIPAQEAREIIWNLCDGVVEKIRYTLRFDEKTWEIDEFLGRNAGLVVAEIELESEEEKFSTPPWLGEEVTADPKYLNVNLVDHPFCDW